MKSFKILFSLAIAFVIGLSSLSAQDKAVKLGPLGFVFGFYNAKYEMKISDKSSLQFGANYYDFELFGAGTTGFGLDAGYRFYFKEAIDGPYAMPNVNFDFNKTSANLGGTTEDLKYSVLGLSALIGWQWVFNNNFLMDLNVGYGADIEVSKDDNLIEDYGRTRPRFNFAIGYAFGDGGSSSGKRR